MRVWLVHWHEAEAAARAAALAAAGHDVRTHWSTERTVDMSGDSPDAVVISLDRLPSHGRAVAGWLTEARKRQHVPVVFVGGKPEKVEATRAKFPSAHYCDAEELEPLLASLATRTRT